MPLDDTIVAIATAPGEAAIAVTRLSGPDALAIAARHFRGARSPLDSPSHRILFGRFTSGGEDVDAVLLSLFRAPHSYTGEDVVEISSHGGAAAPRAILDALIASGARPARPGEFTERAYRNGKLDLAQAESVAAVIRARSDRALRAARASLGGELSRRVEALDAELVGLLAEVESRIDFPGDVRDGADAEALDARASGITETLREWLARLPHARRRDEGIRVAIVGAPNVGKSSLLNALVGYDRAIVSETPGTTRDTVEASIRLGGIELHLTDTAGMRDAADPVERLGVERAVRAAGEADLAIVVLDATRAGGERALAGLGDASALGAGMGADRRVPTIVVWNKTDLAPRGALPLGAEPLAAVETVAVRPGGVEALIEALSAAVPVLVGSAPGDESPALSARQERLLAEALEAMARARDAIRERVAGVEVGPDSGTSARAAAAEIPYDLVAVDLTEARRALAELLGRGVDDAVVAAIFQRFCIGK